MDDRHRFAQIIITGFANLWMKAIKKQMIEIVGSNNILMSFDKGNYLQIVTLRLGCRTLSMTDTVASI